VHPFFIELISLDLKVLPSGRRRPLVYNSRSCSSRRNTSVAGVVASVEARTHVATVLLQPRQRQQHAKGASASIRSSDVTFGGSVAKLILNKVIRIPTFIERAPADR
jgi:hypothetical protein